MPEYAEWIIRRDAETGIWLGVCHSLNLNAIGESFTECAQCADEAMRLLAIDILEDLPPAPSTGESEHDT